MAKEVKAKTKQEQVNCLNNTARCNDKIRKKDGFCTRCAHVRYYHLIRQDKNPEHWYYFKQTNQTQAIRIQTFDELFLTSKPKQRREAK